MAVSEANVYRLLNAWQRVVGEDVWRFNQIGGAGTPASACEVYNQPDREEIAGALVGAWQMVSEALGTFPSPQWVMDERARLGRGVPWELQQLQTRWGNLVEFGRRATSLIEAGATVVYSDSDGDGIHDRATITVTTGVEAGEIHAFFRTADGAPGAADARYQIEPLTAMVNGGTATITGQRALFASPTAVWAKPFAPPDFVTRYAGSTGTAADFVSAVDVYRVYNDPTDAVLLLRDGWAQGSGGSFAASAGIGQIVDGQLGIFRARPADGSVSETPPEFAQVSYRAGMPLVNGAMDRALETAVIRLAHTLLPRELCPFCERAQVLWRADREVGDESTPFGSLRGQVAAWRAVVAVVSRQLAVVR